MRSLAIAATATALLALVIWALASSSGASAIPVGSMPADLREGLAAQGYILEDLSVADQAAMERVVSPGEALSVATREFPSGSGASVYGGKLTVTGNHVGGESTNLVIEGRAVYMVQLTGLNLPPFGVRGSIYPNMIHHELLVFVDGYTGEWVAATEFR